MPAADGPADLAILWDIDGTLLRAAGTGLRSFTIALEALGMTYPSTDIDMAGRTDPEIAGMILAEHGVVDEEMVQLVLAGVEAAWQELEHEYRPLTLIKPGVADLLRRLGEINAVQTLVTGNMQSVARRKVAAVAIDSHLRIELGGYGSDHHLRAELVRVSRSRMLDHGHEIAAERTWIVGDTPRDLWCARANGVRCALVATGSHSFDELSALDADIVFTDLADTEAFLRTVTNS